MTVTNQTIKIYRGNTATLFVALTQADGTPYDPTVDVNIMWRLARSQHSLEGASLVRKSLGNGIEEATVDGVLGVNITLNAGDTDQVPGLYYHELRVQDGEDVSTMMTGTCVIKRALQMGDSGVPDGASAILSGETPTVA